MLKRIRSGFSVFSECLKMSMSNIMGSRVRSFLTVLGIMIGVSAVIALITTVSGFSGALSSRFKSMGVGTLTVSVTGSDLKTGMTDADLAELTGLDIVQGITPSISLRSRVSRGGSYKSNVSVSGRNGFYFSKNPDVLERGRALNIVDENNMSFVCLISHSLMEELFFGTDPVGSSVYVDGVPFLVAGVINESYTANISDMMSGSVGLMIPCATALKMSNANEYTSFTVYLSDGVDSDIAAELLEETMDRMFSYEEDCFKITKMSSIEDTMEEMLSMVSALLAGIASIALVVGGIGIMNMMLTTVTERTAEIGLKKALGALPGQIQLQFLTESFLLSMLGGLLGVLFGLGLSLILCSAMGSTFTFSGEAVALGAGFSAAVGIVFGWAPARKASRLNPIDALRSM